MKRLSLLLAASALLVGCGPSRLPSDFNQNGASNGADILDLRPAGFDRMADAIRSGNIPPEAILINTPSKPRNALSLMASLPKPKGRS